MIFNIPEPLQVEHEELHAELKRIVELNGAVGEAAKVVARLLHKHFAAEEECALPPLGLLAPLAAGELHDDMWLVLKLTDALKERLPIMLHEHQAIVAALNKLSEVAKREKRADVARFAQKLMLHAQREEQVYYPAAILVGEYLRLKMGDREPLVTN